MTIHSFKLNRPAVARASSRPSDRPQRPVNPHAVPVREMAASALPSINRDDMADAAEIARLLSMPFPAFTQAVARLLETLGYANVEAMKAMHGKGKGRNAHGGYDLRMYLPTRLTRGLVLAQVKQYRETVPRSFVDELRGAMLRLGASQGLLVTTGAFSTSAIEAAQAAQYAAPVRLMDGQELAWLLRNHPQALDSVPSPAPIPTTPASASRLRPISREEGERLHQEFLDGLGAPPDNKAPIHQPIMPEPENMTLTLRVAVCLAPALHDQKKTSQQNGASGERRQA